MASVRRVPHITVYARRHLNEQHRIRLAKIIYTTGGWIWAHVKLYKRLYRWNGPLDGDRPAREAFTRSGRRWLGPGWALRFSLGWAEAIDPGHFAHWAFVHKPDCPACDTCGGNTGYCGGDGDDC